MASLFRADQHIELLALKPQSFSCFLALDLWTEKLIPILSPINGLLLSLSKKLSAVTQLSCEVPYTVLFKRVGGSSFG